ncbi:MAG: chemotaxis protein CheW [Acidobacteriota bacterium]
MKKQLVVFTVGGNEFAVDILITKEVVEMRDITPVPETPDYVEGVMNLRGHLVPVLDLRKRMRAVPRQTKEERIIIANLDGKQLGLIVDRASQVIRVGQENIEPAPDIVHEVGASYVEGIVNLGERFVTLIDLRKALKEEVICELEEVARALSRASAQQLAV